MSLDCTTGPCGQIDASHGYERLRGLPAGRVGIRCPGPADAVARVNRAVGNWMEAHTCEGPENLEVTQEG